MVGTAQKQSKDVWERKEMRLFRSALSLSPVYIIGVFPFMSFKISYFSILVTFELPLIWFSERIQKECPDCTVSFSGVPLYIYLLSKLTMKFLQFLSVQLRVASYYPSLGLSSLFQLCVFLFQVARTDCILSGGDITVMFPPIHFAPSRSRLLVGFLMTAFAFGAGAVLNEPSALLFSSLVSCAT